MELEQGRQPEWSGDQEIEVLFHRSTEHPLEKASNVLVQINCDRTFCALLLIRNFKLPSLRRRLLTPVLTDSRALFVNTSEVLLSWLNYFSPGFKVSYLFWLFSLLDHTVASIGTVIFERIAWRERNYENKKANVSRSPVSASVTINDYTKKSMWRSAEEAIQPYFHTYVNHFVAAQYALSRSQLVLFSGSNRGENDSQICQPAIIWFSSHQLSCSEQAAAVQVFSRNYFFFCTSTKLDCWMQPAIHWGHCPLSNFIRWKKSPANQKRSHCL